MALVEPFESFCRFERFIESDNGTAVHNKFNAVAFSCFDCVVPEDGGNQVSASTDFCDFI